MIVKICGLLEPNDAEAAGELGADMVGVIFAPSHRQRTLNQAATIFDAAPAHVERVGVFVNETIAAVHEAISACRLDRVQFGGIESPVYCRTFGSLAIKTMRLPKDHAIFDTFNTRLFHLDTPSDQRAGGTGQSWDYALAQHVTHSYRVLLGGGLTPSNVSNAIELARPYGVDVSSGVETNHKKDHDKIELLIKNARRDLTRESTVS